MTVARIPFPDDAAVAAALGDSPPPMRKAAERGALINVFRMLMYSPDVGVAVAELGSAIFACAALTDIDRELAILACGACFRAPYEASQHDPISRAVGAPCTTTVGSRGLVSGHNGPCRGPYRRDWHLASRWNS